MRIGITVHFQYSFFSAGSPQTALAIAEVFRIKGHDVFFINIGDNRSEWWDDVKDIEKDWKKYQHTELEGKGLDIVFEIGSHFLKPNERVHSKHCVWVYRKNPLFQDTEACLYPISNPVRDLTKINEIWLFEELITQDDIEYLKTLHKLPVRVVPFLWTPSAVEIQRRTTNAPVWQQVYGMEEVKYKPWSIHICETNTSSGSSCTIPLCITREIKKKSACFLERNIKIHNAEHVKMSDFFKGNVLDHCFSDMKDIHPEFLGRQRIIDLVYDPKSVIIAHSRFIFIKPYILDALWVGIPILHNCDEIQKIGITEGFYKDNEISKAVEEFEKIVLQRSTNMDNLKKTRQAIIERFSPYCKKIQDAWCNVLDKISPLIEESKVKVEAKVENDSLEKKSKESPLPSSEGSNSIGESPIKVEEKSVESERWSAKSLHHPTEKSVIRVGFCDMWDSFNPEYNQFTLMLEAATIGRVRKIVGIDLEKEEAGKEEVDVVIFGPFGNRWRSVRGDIPKVHFTGENTEPIQDESVKLNLGFKHGTLEGNYLRLPLWMLEINWFRADIDKIQNPKPIPIDRCCKVDLGEMERKKKFCAFVVTNPRQQMRNNAFHWLSEYKKVDSAGRLFNNIGDSIFAGLGGGGGEVKKLEFLKDYKFCLAFENDSEAGYTTEKYLHAKAAGCIPIYWGDPKFERDFDINGCIDARNILTKSELIELVKNVDDNDELWKSKFLVPALDEVKRDLVRRTLSECARRILKLCKLSENELNMIPRFLGYTEDAVETNKVCEIKNKKTIFVTGANEKFLPSLEIWLNSIKQQDSKENSIEMKVYLMDNVSEDTEIKYKEKYPLANFYRFPKKGLEEFSDLWAPEHFAWKLWILKEIVNDKELEGYPVIYLDSGVMMCSWPEGWYRDICKNGMSVLEDPRQENRRWCHKEFCERMNVTEEELDKQQIWAGCLGFVGGNEKAKNLLNEAWKWGQIREVIVGPKWIGQGVDGRPYGHRHDQSILSILTDRYKVARYDLDEIYCDVSLRHAYMKRKSMYAHRGFLRVHDQVATGIDDVFLINLDRRKDRLERFKLKHPDLADRILRLRAFDSKHLQLTRKIARLFMPHDFKWKKAVMGCALSHLAIWMQLLNDKPEVNTYLVLEDDVRLKPEWRRAWETANRAGSIPSDYDVIYLGGILPPNKEAFEALGVEKINEHIARVKENYIFGQQPPNRYFHFCAYSYVLSRRGAKKIIDFLKARNGYWTSADHMMCNLQDYMNIYFLHPLVAGCYQEDDPVYCTSAFNDFSRKDTFDSDLWNNNEHFTEEEVRGILHDSDELDILGALDEANKQQIESEIKSKKKISENKPIQEDTTKKVEDTSKILVEKKTRRIVSLYGDIDSSKWYEYSWFRQIFTENAGISLNIEKEDGIPTDEPIVIYQRPHCLEILGRLEEWRKAGVKFYLLHISDEFGMDPISVYEWEECLGVLRNYVRKDLKESEKVKVIPLGFHWAISNGEPSLHTPRPPFREYIWSFVGTGWKGRKEKMEILKKIPGDNKCILQENWGSPDALGKEETLSILLNSLMVPCPGGQNAETFRFYEALEAGAVPILVKEEGNDEYLEYLGRWFKILIGSSWEQAAALIHTLREKPEVYEQYRIQLLYQWELMKKDVKKIVKDIYKL